MTIPLPIRSEFGFTPGTDIEFVVEGERVVVKRRKKGNPVEAWLKEATGMARGRTTTSKVMKLTRGE